MKRYRIIAICDPYNARRHYRGQEVLRYDMATPVEWVMEDYLTEQQAHEMLNEYAFGLKGAMPYDDEFISELRHDLIEDGISVEDVDRKMSWYVGEGWYNDGVLLYQYGDDYLRDDVMLYRIEERE